MIKMDKKMEMEEMAQVSGGMRSDEWNAYNKRYDVAMFVAQDSGDKKLYEKLKNERIYIHDMYPDWRPWDDMPNEYKNNPPYAKWKLEDMPNVELVYKMCGQKVPWAK